MPFSPTDTVDLLYSWDRFHNTLMLLDLQTCGHEIFTALPGLLLGMSNKREHGLTMLTIQLEKGPQNCSNGFHYDSMD